MDERSVVVHVLQPTEAGVPAVVRQYVDDQVARGWSVTVVAPHGRLGRDIEVAGAGFVEWHATRAPGPRTAVEVVTLARTIERLDPQIVHLHSSKAGLAGRLAIRGRIPTVFQPHGWSFWAVGGVAQSAACRWERAAARWTDALVCVSDAERSAGVAAGISAPWTVVPNGIDLSRWTAASNDDKSAARDRLGIGDEPLVVCVGRLTRQKGQDVAVASWGRVRRRVPDARLVLVGDGPDRDRLERAGGPGVSLVGDRNDVPDWLAAADVAVLPSRWEGMSLSLLEAMARSRPVVATDVAGMREVLSAGGGAIVPPDDVGSLAEAIAGRLENRQILDAEGARARRTIEERHDVVAATDRIARLYGDVLRRRRGDHV